MKKNILFILFLFSFFNCELAQSQECRNVKAGTIVDIRLRYFDIPQLKAIKKIISRNARVNSWDKLNKKEIGYDRAIVSVAFNSGKLNCDQRVIHLDVKKDDFEKIILAEKLGEIGIVVKDNECTNRVGFSGICDDRIRKKYIVKDICNCRTNLSDFEGPEAETFRSKCLQEEGKIWESKRLCG